MARIQLPADMESSERRVFSPLFSSGSSCAKGVKLSANEPNLVSRVFRRADRAFLGGVRIWATRRLNYWAVKT
jgi:hypothetical protein